MSKWRIKAQVIVSEVIAENHNKPIREIREALRNAYPWGQRVNHPYKVWLDECRTQVAMLESQRNPEKDTEGLPLFEKYNGSLGWARQLKETT